jgi:putative hemolysin
MNLLHISGFAVFLALFCASASASLIDPSFVYCTEMGYSFHIVETPEGDLGACELPDGSLVNSWWFLEGRVKEEYSYCAVQGYETKIVSDERCENIYSGSGNCTVCVLPDGSEAELKELMGMNFSSLVCGDGVCGMGPENYLTCPEDCPSNASDGICNPQAGDGCDPDCEGGEDPDCIDEDFWEQESVPEPRLVDSDAADSLPIIILIITIVVVLISLVLFKGRKSAP